MNKKDKKPFLPEVSPQDLLAFRIGKPETYTKSRLINAVCEAFETIGYSPRNSIAEYMCVDPKDLTGAIRLATGMGARELRMFLVKNKLENIKQEHPGMSTDEMARLLGFTNRSALFSILGEDDYLKEVAKYKHRRR